MQGLLDFFTNPAHVAVFVAILGALRGIGEALLRIAETWHKPELGKIAKTLLEGLEQLGRLLAWLGLGNSETYENHKIKRY